jgi:hypothetical protein
VKNEMELKAERNSDYYEFLNTIQIISKKVNAVQNNSIRIVFENYDLNIVKNRINELILNYERSLKK